VAGRDMQAYFDKFIYGTAPLEEPLDKALSFVGCTLRAEQNPSVAEGMFGFRAVMKNERAEITDILPDSPAAAVFTIDDEIVAVNGRRVTSNLQSLLSGSPENLYEVSVFRQNRLLTVPLTARNGQRFWQKFIIEKLPEATAEQQASFRGWLKQEF
jgi:predicted metalloprotease with PDZ domain